jgi:tetratricopeptide (TPR) repeat protein
MNPHHLRAIELIREGQALVIEEKISDALEKFKESVTIYPTPQGYTYWAWMLSYDHDLPECIELCKKAIELDPEFGNAYNDIGSYLIEMDECEDAIPWLIKAKTAKNYDARHFPYLNLARAYLKLGRDEESREEYSALLELDPYNVEGLFLSRYLDNSDQGDTFSSLFSTN